MSMPQENPETASVLCTTCHSLVEVRVWKTSGRSTCPECQASVRVPSLEEVQRKRRTTLPTQDVGQYKLADNPGDDVKIADYVKVICPTCGTRLHPEVKDRPYRLKCPDCYVKVRVPARNEIPKERKRKTPKVSPYGLDTIPEPPPVYTEYLEVQAEIRQEEAGPPPVWTFFSGVFSFPWHSDSIVRWAFLSVGCVAVGMIAALVVSLFHSLDGSLFLALAFFILPAIWLSIWTSSYAAACFLTILVDTAGGNHRVSNWLEPNWREWAAQLLYVAFLAMIVGVTAYGIGLAAAISGGSFWLVFGIVCFVLYPVVLLSSLEANSTLVPLSRPILRSFARLWWGWLLFYGLSVAVWGVWIGSVWWGLSMSGPFLTFLLTGPVLAAAVFIYARLLGRLGWRATVEAAPMRNKRSSGKFIKRF